MSWSKEQVTLLIDEYEKYPCLYAVKSPMYKNKHARQSALENIEKVLRPLRPTVTINEIKTKFHGLKTTFLTEYKKYQSSRHSGAGDDVSYHPTIWYFQRLFFTLDHTSNRKAIDSIEEDSNEIQHVEDQIQEDENTLDMFHESEHDATEEFVVGPEGFLASDNSRPSTSSGMYLSSDNSRPSTSTGMYQISTPPKLRKTSKTSNVYQEVLIKEASQALETISTTVKQNFKNNNYVITPNEAFASFVTSKLNQISDENIRLDVEQEITNKL